MYYQDNSYITLICFSLIINTQPAQNNISEGKSFATFFSKFDLYFCAYTNYIYVALIMHVLWHSRYA